MENDDDNDESYNDYGDGDDDDMWLKLTAGRRQAITNFSEIRIEILTFSFKNMRLNMSFAKWRPLCPVEVSYRLDPDNLSGCHMNTKGISYEQHLVKLELKTISMRGSSYLGLIRSKSWLLMPWLLASPGHQ